LTRIRVKLGQAEAEVDAEPDRLREAIDLVPELLAKLPVSGFGAPEGRRGASEPLPQGQERTLSAEFPIVSLEKGDSLADVIEKFFAAPWGRERRKLSDVREALQSYGLNYPKQSVAVALLRLAKTTKLRRFKAEDGEYVYTSADAVSLAPRSADEQVLGELAAAQVK
jgi:hypothetical protein